MLGDLGNYAEVASNLPTNTRFFYRRVDQPPPGYDPQVYGQWPGPIWVFKARYAPSWKSALSDPNWHTVTMMVTVDATLNNLLTLGPMLSRIFALVCDCMAGLKTNSCCAHHGALIKATMAAACYRSRKVNEARITDIYRWVQSELNVLLLTLLSQAVRAPAPGLRATQ